jgi:hypothetical protein
MAAAKKSYFPASAKKGLPVSPPRPEKENPQNPTALKRAPDPASWETSKKCPAF